MEEVKDDDKREDPGGLGGGAPASSLSSSLSTSIGAGAGTGVGEWDELMASCNPANPSLSISRNSVRKPG